MANHESLANMQPIDVTDDLDPDRCEELLKVMRLRRSVRSFEAGRRVSREVLLQIAEAGRWAPSGANSQPWDICIVEDPEAIGSTAQVLSAQADRLNEHCRGFPHVHKKHWVHDAVAIVVLFIDVRWSEAYPVALDPTVDDAEYAANREQILLVSAGAATQNIQLAAAAVGLTSAWLSGGGEPQTAREMQDLLGFPATHVPYAIVPIGWPHRRAESRWRRDLVDVVHWNSADPANLRSQDDIDHYIDKERRDSIYRDAKLREQMLTRDAASPEGSDPPDIDPVDEGA